MRVPDPKANTTTEAYLAYKAGYLEESELKPVLYEPYLHFDAWLAYWAGLTETYPTDKNENPECLTDEEALVAYLSGVTNTYPEEIKDPYDVRIVGYLKYLVSARWGRPDYPVNNEEFYLSTMDAPHTSNETPSADIELDTSAGKIISVGAYGDTYQQTYSGKNKFDYEGASDIDNTFVASYRLFEIKGLKPNTEYTISGWSLTTPIPDTYIYIWSAPAYPGLPTNFIASPDNIITTPIKITTQEDGKKYLAVYPSDETTWANVIAYFEHCQIEEGSTATSWEKFVGGIPSPNPEYPQDIQTVTGEQTVVVTGKNLLDTSGIIWNGSSTGIVTNGNIEITNLSQGTPFRLPIKIPAGTTFTLSLNIEAVNGGDCYWQFYNADGTLLQSVGIITSGTTNTVNRTLSCSDDVAYIVCACSSIGTKNKYNFTSIQIENGSKKTSFEPYTSQSYPISLDIGNMAPMSDFQIGGMNGGNPSSNVKYQVNNAGHPIKVSPNTQYTISAKFH